MPPIQPENPFTVKSAEQISATDASTLFVDVFTDFPKVPHPGHTFIHGPRGSGKSMMFRYLQPDCQSIVTGAELCDLSFFGVFIPVKNSSLPTIELRRLKRQHANVILNEHFMVIDFASRIAAHLCSVLGVSESEHVVSAKAFVSQTFKKLLIDCGWEGELTAETASSAADCFAVMKETCSAIALAGLRYLKRLSTGRPPTYEGVLCGYQDFLLPLVQELRALPFMPKGPVFLMIDDADNLNKTQTMILNSWVAMRTISELSLKISTQLRYETFRTISGHLIEAPHDYTEINIATVYTSSKSRYAARVREIIQKRFNLARIDSTPDEFFPVDQKQEDAIRAIEAQYIERWSHEQGRGFRARDDALRYARPDFIADLKGVRKSGSSYSYAGFEQLAHISSGLIRCFLDSAAQMFAQQIADHADQLIVRISPEIQNSVVRQEATNLLFNGLELLAAEPSEEEGYHQKVTLLTNLINSLGGTFHQILLTRNRSERRVFSIAFSDQPDPETLSVLKLGVQHGYFHLSSIGNKDGTGRTRLWVLTRRLAPAFLLDPSGFAGYLFVTTDFVRRAMTDRKLIRHVKDAGVDEYFANGQLALFE